MIFNLILKLSVFSLPLAYFFALNYRPYDSNIGILTLFSLSSIGHFFIYFFLVCLVFIYTPFLFIKKRGIKCFIYTSFILFLSYFPLALDSQVFALYKFHVNLAMLDLFFNTKGEVISFNYLTMLTIAWQILALLVYALLCSYFAFVLKKFKAKKIALGIFAIFISMNLTHAYANAKGINQIADFTNRLPLYRPLTAKGTFLKLGLVNLKDLQNNQVNMNFAGSFNYPLNTLEYDHSKAKKLNVIMILVDSLRYDMLNPQVMPNTFEFAQKNIVFNNYYSASNSTRGGIFGLFYGLPPSYWNAALSGGKRSALVQAAIDNNYKLGIFASAPLYKPEFNQTVFYDTNIALETKGDSPIQRDQMCIKNFENFIKENKDNQFFSFIFLDNVHSYQIPEDPKYKVFTPAADYINYASLDQNTDKSMYLNLYKNAVHYADGNIGKILDIIHKANLDDNSIVIISADHGEELNDNNLNYWGHNSNFTDIQIKTPMIMHIPTKEPRVENRLTNAYDISATLLPYVFGCTNKTQDYSIGENLIDLKDDRSFTIVGSYLDSAIVQKDNIILINKLGLLSYLDKSYRPIDHKENNQNLYQSFELFTKYLR